MPDWLMISFAPRAGTYKAQAERIIHMHGGCWEYGSVDEDGYVEAWCPTCDAITMRIHITKGNLWFKVLNKPKLWRKAE